ncbi:MAG: hypothetical protein VB142_05710 [Burkholderia sp.]
MQTTQPRKPQLGRTIPQHTPATAAMASASLGDNDGKSAATRYSRKRGVIPAAELLSKMVYGGQTKC